MSSNSFPDRRVPIPELLRRGLLAGIAGGLAEVAVVSLYCAGAGISAPGVARHIASAVHLDGASAWTGLTIHLALAALLGIVLAFAWNRMRGNFARTVPPYAPALLTLAMVWAINFFVVLPVLSPDFVTLLPLTVTLVSKLMFGAAAAITFGTRFNAPARNEIQRRREPSPQVAAAA